VEAVDGEVRGVSNADLNDRGVIRSSPQHREKMGRGSAPELTEEGGLVMAQLRCGGTPVEENRCEVVDERLLTEELLQNLRTKREGL
jgi:hypothetical protein